MPDWMPAAIVGLVSAGLFTWLLPTLRGLRGRADKAETRLATLEALCLERDGRDPPLLRGFATHAYVDEHIGSPAELFAKLSTEMAAHDRRFTEHEKRVNDRFDAHERRLTERIDRLEAVVREALDQPPAPAGRRRWL